MRMVILLAIAGVAWAGCADAGSNSTAEHINPVIPLLEHDLPVLGVMHPPYVARRPWRAPDSDAPPPEPMPEPDLDEAARELVAYEMGDYVLNNYSPQSADRYRGFMEAIVTAGGSARSHPFMAKIPIMHDDPAGASQALIDQLNDGQVIVAMQEVETAEEIEQTVAAMRFASKGGVRPETGFERAAAYWGMTAEEYMEKADVWPLNPEGELLITAIVESEAGVANVREIAASPAIAIVTVGAGTLGGVFTSVDENGERVRDQEGFDAAVAQILAACKEFEKSCGYPANNPAEVEALMNDGWDFFIMQRRNQDAFDAVVAGRQLSGRETEDG
jgi:4-hydroxy-2-oxoheptanedioate aldolase